MRGGSSAAVALLIVALVPAPAAAYLDPISGSIILQVVAASALAASFTIKRWWSFVRDGARRLLTRGRD